MPGVAKVDPNCAICRAPANHGCQCEAHAFEVAVAQAEERFFKPTLDDIRAWVRQRAKDYILAYFHLISEPCKDAYAMHLDAIKETLKARKAAPTPDVFARAESEYRRNIDRAWSLAVRRYPEVLGYFYSLVHVSLPADRDVAVMHPPMDRLGDLKHAQRRMLMPQHEAPTPSFPMPPLPPPPKFAAPPPKFAPPQPPPAFAPPPPLAYAPNAAQWQTPPPSPPHYYGPKAPW